MIELSEYVWQFECSDRILDTKPAYIITWGKNRISNDDLPITLVDEDDPTNNSEYLTNDEKKEIAKEVIKHWAEWANIEVTFNSKELISIQDRYIKALEDYVKQSQELMKAANIAIEHLKSEITIKQK